MWQKRVDSFLLVVLTLSLILNVILGWKRRGQQASVPVQLRVGAQFPKIFLNQAESVEEHSFRSGPRGTVIYVVSPACNWCNRNTKNINSLAASASSRYRFVGISLSSAGLRKYLRDHELKFPVYVGLPDELRRGLGLGLAPQTIVLSNEGKVLKNWIGAYTDRVKDEVEQYFGIELPGVDPP